MPTSPHHNHVPRPDESDLLAWIEDAPLPRDRRIAVLSYLASAEASGDAEARRLAGMKRDCDAVRSLGEAVAPPGLLEAVEARLQRDALAGLTNGAAVSDRPPVMRTGIHPPVLRHMGGHARRSGRAGARRLLLADARGQRWAAAAAILLLVGASAYLATVVINRSLDSVGPLTGPIATAPTAIDPLSTRTGVDHPDAADDGRGAGTTGPSLADAGARDEAAPTDEPAIAAATATGETAAGGAPVALDADAAAALMLEGRLGIRVSTDRVELTMTRLREPGGRASREDAAAGWRLLSAPPPDVLAAIVPPARATVTPTAASGPAPEMASSGQARAHGGVESPAGAAAGAPSFPPPASAADRVLMLTVRADAAALESARRAIESESEGRAEFVRLPRPLPEDAHPPTHAAAVFWWTSPPQAWGAWTRVPVIVDRLTGR